MRELIHPDRRKLVVQRMGIQLHAELCHVARGGVMALRRQARAVDVVRIGKAQLLRALVHPAHERLLRAIHILRERHGRVVCAGDDHALEQVAQPVILVGVQEHLTAAHARGTRRHWHAVAEAHAPVIDRLQRQQDGHHLRHAGDGPPLVRVLLEDDLARPRLRQDHARAGEGKGRALLHRRFAQRKPRQQQGDRKHDGDKHFFH